MCQKRLKSKTKQTISTKEKETFISLDDSFFTYEFPPIIRFYEPRRILWTEEKCLAAATNCTRPGPVVLVVVDVVVIVVIGLASSRGGESKNAHKDLNKNIKYQLLLRTFNISLIRQRQTCTLKNVKNEPSLILSYCFVSMQYVAC